MVPIYALVQEPETKGGNVVAKDSTEVSRSREAVDVHATEVNDLLVLVRLFP